MFIDITIRPNKDTTCWPGEQPLKINSIRTDNNCVSSCIQTSCHYGTHIDAPLHFIKNGQTVDKIALDTLCGPVEVIDVGQSKSITLQHVKTVSMSRVIFKTCNRMQREFTTDYCFIEPEAATCLVESSVKLVGINYISVESFNNKNFDTHRILLSNNVVIIEGLDLSNVDAGKYCLYALPLKIETEAAPARVILSHDLP